jgi:hypothetical protein
VWDKDGSTPLQAKLQRVVRQRQQIFTRPIYSSAASPSRLTPLLQSGRRRISGYSSSTMPNRLHQHRLWSSSPTTIYITNIATSSPPSPLMVNVKRRQDLLLIEMPRNFKQKIRV